MIVIICIDDNGGMMFNRRRQSRDRLLRQRVLDMEDFSRLLMNEFSSEQFEEKSSIITVSESFLEDAGENDCCFVEDRSLKPFEDRIEKLIVYRWNRVYPSDFRLDLNLEAWTLIQSADFEGSSHEKITEEVYVH